MVKKVGGGKGSINRGTSAVESSKSVKTSKVGSSSQVEKTEKKVAAGRARRPTRPMTSAEREHLFSLIQEEADKMFGPEGLPQSQRATVETAVKMAIDSSLIEEGEED